MKKPARGGLVVFEVGVRFPGYFDIPYRHTLRLTISILATAQ